MTWFEESLPSLSIANRLARFAMTVAISALMDDDGVDGFAVGGGRAGVAMTS